MAENDRDEIVAALRKEEDRVSAAAQEAREKAKALEKELKGIRSALAALTGESTRTAKKKTKQDAKPPSTDGNGNRPAKQRKKEPQGQSA